MAQLKRCKDCDIEKNVDEFSVTYVNKKGVPHYQSRCKPCIRVKSKAWYDIKRRKPKIETNLRVCTNCGVAKEKNETNFYPVFVKTKRGIIKCFCSPCRSCKAINDKQRWAKQRKPKVIETLRTCKGCGARKDLNATNFQAYVQTYKTTKYNSFAMRCIPCSLFLQREKYNNDPEIIYKREVRNRNEEAVKIRNAIRKSISNRILTALKKIGRSKNGKSILNFLPYSMDDLIHHLESQFEPWMNWSNWGRFDEKNWKDDDPSTWTWQIDHIIPHSIFAYTSMGDPEFFKCWELSNLRPLSAKRNILEGRKLGKRKWVPAI